LGSRNLQQPAQVDGSVWCSAPQVVATNPIGGLPESSRSWSAVTPRHAW